MPFRITLLPQSPNPKFLIRTYFAGVHRGVQKVHGIVNIPTGIQSHRTHMPYGKIRKLETIIDFLTERPVTS